MLDTDRPASARYVSKYGVRDLPHFEFFAAGGVRSEIPEAGGPVDAQRIAERVRFLVFPDADEN